MDRWSLYAPCGGGTMSIDPNGKYVLYDDAQAALAEKDKEIQTIKNMLIEAINISRERGDELDKQENELEAKDAEIVTLQDSLAAKEQERLGQILSSETELAAANLRSDVANDAEIAELKAQLAAKETELAAANHRFDVAAEIAKDMLREKNNA